eukprot:CAMPEP_0172864508 /NCGR_PEP_ID=MMETSP1075-20121228/80480_1 /TAXON_ID=2916 /ORGANISM="Ceratium fusus, Strain PA161109" /LENGTH=140 /DNA_ID=CAMNT_0013713413 /DNA_START=39 /DNA_END=458 /DNA_ORIENTATION=+
MFNSRNHGLRSRDSREERPLPGQAAHILWGRLECFTSDDSNSAQQDRSLQLDEHQAILMQASSSSHSLSNSKTESHTGNREGEGGEDGDEREEGEGGGGGCIATGSAQEAESAACGRKPEYSAGAESHHMGKCKPCAWHW